METFAQRITKRRRHLRLTQKQVADVIGVPLSTYKEWEYGRRIQGEIIYVRPAEALEINLYTLLTGQPVGSKDLSIQKIQNLIEQLNEIKKLLLSSN